MEHFNYFCDQGRMIGHFIFLILFFFCERDLRAYATETVQETHLHYLYKSSLFTLCV